VDVDVDALRRIEAKHFQRSSALHLAISKLSMSRFSQQKSVVRFYGHLSERREQLIASHSVWAEAELSRNKF